MISFGDTRKNAAVLAQQTVFDDLPPRVLYRPASSTFLPVAVDSIIRPLHQPRRRCHRCCRCLCWLPRQGDDEGGDRHGRVDQFHRQDQPSPGRFDDEPPRTNHAAELSRAELLVYRARHERSRLTREIIEGYQHTEVLLDRARHVLSGLDSELIEKRRLRKEEAKKHRDVLDEVIM